MIQDGAGVELEAARSPSRSSAVGTVNWGTATLVGVFAGLLYGGSREASASVVSGLSTLPAAWFSYCVLSFCHDALYSPCCSCSAAALLAFGVMRMEN